MIRQYLRNWSLFLRGFRWLWTRRLIGETGGYYTLADGSRVSERKLSEWTVRYKPGWSPLKFCVLVYWWDYGLACLLGRGVQSMSRAFTMFGKSHWKMTGGLLWGSKDLWR